MDKFFGFLSVWLSGSGVTRIVYGVTDSTWDMWLTCIGMAVLGVALVLLPKLSSGIGWTQ